MRSERVRFPGAHGSDLVGRIELPDGEPRAFALFAHCFTCSKDLRSEIWICRALTEKGIAVLRFDFTGLGESEGEFPETTFSSNLEDIRAAVAFLRRDHQAPRIMLGHSLGGAAVLATADEVPECRAVAVIAAPSDTAHLGRLLLRSAPEIETEGEAEVTIGERKLRIRRQLLDDLGSHRMDRQIRELDRPLLIFHSPQDDVVGIEHARRIFELAKHPKSFVSLDGADHLLLRSEADARYVGEVLAAWAGRYL